MLALTGASGYLGSALLAQWRRQGILPLTLGRGPVDPGVQHRHLDLNASGGFREALGGVSTLVHCAGVAHHRGSPTDYRRLNADAVMSLADAAVHVGCQRLIFISTLNIVPCDAASGSAPAATYRRPADPYSESKWRAEQHLEALLADSAVELVILRPALLYDRELTANLWRLQQQLRRWPIALPPVGQRPLVARPDVVDLIALEVLAPPGKPTVRRLSVTDGQCYHLARIGRALLQHAVPDHPWRVPLPASLLRALARALDWQSGLPGGTSWAGLAGDKWCGEPIAVADWAPRWRLESLCGDRP